MVRTLERTPDKNCESATAAPPPTPLGIAPDPPTSWIVRHAPLRAAAVGIVLLILGVTTDGFGVLIWVGLTAVAVEVGGTIALRRQEHR